MTTERLADKLQRLLLEEEAEHYRDREEVLTSTRAPASHGAESELLLAPRDRSETPESRLPEALLLRVLSFCPAEDLCRSACVCHRWKSAAESDKLWKLCCKGMIARFHPQAGPLGSPAAMQAAERERRALAAAPPPSSTPVKGGAGLAPIHAGTASAGGPASSSAPLLDPLTAAILPPLLSPTTPATPTPGALAAAFPLLPTAAATGTTSGETASILPPLSPAEAAAYAPRQEVSLSIARQRQLDQEAAREAKIVAERETYRAARDLMIGLFKSAVLAAKPKPSYRLGFRSIALVRLNGFYSLAHRYIRTPLQDAFHKVDGILSVTYHRAFRFLPDGRCLYVLSNGKLSDVVKSFRAAWPLLDKYAPAPSSAAAARHPLRLNVYSGAFEGEPSFSIEGAAGAGGEEDDHYDLAHIGAGGAGAGGAGAGGAGGGKKKTAREIREEKEKERLNQNLGFGYWELWGDTVRARVSLANTVTHWSLVVCSSPAFYEDERVMTSHKASDGAAGGAGAGGERKPAIPEGYMDRLTIKEAPILCEYGATLEQGSAISSLEGEQFEYTPLEWSRV